jgi:hypothetical protein
MVKRIAGALALAYAMALAAGCATIVHGTTERVQIDSTPPGAEVAVDDSQHLVTPSAVNLARGSAHKLVFHKPGYQDTTENLTSGFSGWILGNVLAGGVVGMAIDASDGAGHKLSADHVNVALTPLPSTPIAVAGPTHQTAAVTGPAGAQPATLLHDTPTVAQPEGSQPAVVPARP